MLKINNQTDGILVFGDITESIPASGNVNISPDKEFKWANSQDVLVSITNGDIKIERNGVEYTDYSDQVNALKNLSSDVNIISNNSEQQPFASKILSNGKRLFRRKHGIAQVIPANSSAVISMTVPYASCKINKAEIVNCSAGDMVDFKIYDTSAGTISGITDHMLNQFGFSVVMPDNFYEDESNYDADLIQDMKVKFTYTNNSNLDRNIGINVTFHEIVG